MTLDNMLLTSVVFFRTLPNGSYRYMRGLRRGYYRLQDVQQARGSQQIHAHNVVRVIATSPEGIDGVTERSRYDISGYADRFIARADRLNAARNAAWLDAVHHAE